MKHARLFTIVFLFAALLASSAAPPAKESRPDPAAWMPKDFRVYVEGRDAAAFIALLSDASFRADAPKELERAYGILDRVAALKPKRFAFGAELGDGKPSAFFVELENEASAKSAARFLREATEGKGVAFVVETFAAVCSDADTMDRVVAAAEGRAAGMDEREELREARRSDQTADLFFHLDLSGTRLLRLGVARPREYLQALFGSHVLLAAATAESVSMRATFDDGLRLVATAPVKPLGEDRAYAAPASRPTDRMLLPPDGSIARFSFRRDVASFWEGRATVVPEAAQAGLAEFRNNLTVLLGGLAPEDVFAGLGVQYDLFMGPPPTESPAPRHRFPTIALVAEVSDPALRAEWTLGFQTTIGVVNAQAAQERGPRYMLETVDVQGVRVTSARFLPELLPDRDDDRLQLRPSLAFAGSRMILGSHPDLVGALAANAAAGREEVRPPGDVLMIDGAAAAKALRAALPFITPREALKEGKSESEVARNFELLARLLERSGLSRASFAIVGAEARFTVSAGSAKGDDAPPGNDAR